MSSADEMRSRVEQELLSTEETYVREMTTLIEVTHRGGGGLVWGTD